MWQEMQFYAQKESKNQLFGNSPNGYPADTSRWDSECENMHTPTGKKKKRNAFNNYHSFSV